MKAKTIYSIQKNQRVFTVSHWSKTICSYKTQPDPVTSKNTNKGFPIINNSTVLFIAMKFPGYLGEKKNLGF